MLFEFLFVFLPVFTVGTISGTLVFGVPLECLGVQQAYCIGHALGILSGIVLGNSACSMTYYGVNTFEYIGMKFRALRKAARNE